MGAAIRAAGLVFRRPLQAPRALTTRTAHCANCLVACLPVHTIRYRFSFSTQSFFFSSLGIWGGQKKTGSVQFFFLTCHFFLICMYVATTWTAMYTSRCLQKSSPGSRVLSTGIARYACPLVRRNEWPLDSSWVSVLF